MSYVPTNWKDGDIVTSSKLNKIELGIVDTNGALIINLLEEDVFEITASALTDTTLDVTLEEVMKAFNAGKSIYLHLLGYYFLLTTLLQDYFGDQTIPSLYFTGAFPTEIIVYTLTPDSNVLSFSGIFDATSTIIITFSNNDTYQTDLTFNDIYTSTQLLGYLPTVIYRDLYNRTTYFGELLSINAASLTVEIKFYSTNINNGQVMEFTAEDRNSSLSYSLPDLQL